MQGSLAAQAYAGPLLKQCLSPLRDNLVVSATVAEENGASVGMHTLIERTLSKLGMRPTVVILGEPTGLGLYYGHDGWSWILASSEPTLFMWRMRLARCEMIFIHTRVLWKWNSFRATHHDSKL